ncbi:histone deacetylase, partial [candidate division GN15 bacterium]|nr:histone deacetylase [candidate division GN15 bacterium]
MPDSKANSKVGLIVTAAPDSHPAPPGHPERYERLGPTIDYLTEGEGAALVQPLKLRSYDIDLIKRIHDPAYVDQLAAIAAQGGGDLDAETHLTASSFDASCELTWALLTAVEDAFAIGPKRSFVIGRPPGHHAEYDRGMGFCLVNHVAVAAQFAFDRGLARRVAIVDCDVHHGKGTQHAFYERSDVFFVSSHQYPYYPGTGAAQDVGRGEGEGTTLNLPMSGGTGNDELLVAYDRAWEALVAYDPDLVLVSAGFDAHRQDPLAALELTSDCYGDLARHLVSLADSCCDGRVVATMEGGYNPQANRE